MPQGTCIQEGLRKGLGRNSVPQREVSLSPPAYLRTPSASEYHRIFLGAGFRMKNKVHSNITDSSQRKWGVTPKGHPPTNGVWSPHMVEHYSAVKAQD